MLRISDARMRHQLRRLRAARNARNRTSAGPLALVQTGDVIAIDIEARSINMLVSDDELARRRATLETTDSEIHTRLWCAVASNTSSRPTRLRL